MDRYAQDFLDGLIRSNLYLLRRKNFWRLKAKLKYLGVDLDKGVLLNRLRNIQKRKNNRL